MIENPILWPNGARCAVAITFDLDAESLVHINLGDVAPNKVALSSLLRYGPEVAIPRIVNAFKQYRLNQTFFVPAWCIERYPRAIERILEGGHELGHHSYIHESPNQLSRDEEEEFLVKGIEIIERVSGKRPRGYRAPSYQMSRHTLDLLLKHGFLYDSSLLGHDIPHLISNGEQSLVEIPGDLSLDDWNQFGCFKDFNWLLPIASPERAFEVYRAEFEALWKYGGVWMAIWHPFVSGRASRCDAMMSLIEHMQAKGGVWFATLEEIALHTQRCIAEGWEPRVDRLPFNEEPLEGVPWGRKTRVG